MRKLQGNEWVDLFGAVMLIRLVAPLFHLPPMNAAEAGVWAATISAFAYSNVGGGPKQS